MFRLGGATAYRCCIAAMSWFAYWMWRLRQSIRPARKSQACNLPQGENSADCQSEETGGLERRIKPHTGTNVFWAGSINRLYLPSSMVVLVVNIREVWMHMCQWFVPVLMAMPTAGCHRVIMPVLVVFVVDMLVVMHHLFVGVFMLMVLG